MYSKPQHSLVVVSGEATCMADVCTRIVFMSEFMDPQGAAEPEVVSHDIRAASRLLTAAAIFLYAYSYFRFSFGSSVFQSFRVLFYTSVLKAISRGLT